MKKLKYALLGAGLALGINSSARAESSLKGQVEVEHSQVSGSTLDKTSQTEYQLNFGWEDSLKAKTSTAAKAKEKTVGDMEYRLEAAVNTISGEEEDTAFKGGFGLRLKKGIFGFLGKLAYRTNSAEALANKTPGSELEGRLTFKVGREVSALADLEGQYSFPNSAFGLNASTGAAYQFSEKVELAALVNHERELYLERDFTSLELRGRFLPSESLRIDVQGNAGQKLALKGSLIYDLDEHFRVKVFAAVEESKSADVKKAEHQLGLNLGVRY